MDTIFLFDECNEVVTNEHGTSLTTTAFQFVVINANDRFTLRRNGFGHDADRWEEYMERMAKATLEDRITVALEFGLREEQLVELGLYEVGDRFDQELVKISRANGILRATLPGDDVRAKLN
jgi:hypothetical protein